VLDASGTTIAVNAALERFARDDPLCELRPGVSFLARCEERAVAGDAGRAALARALRAMLSGERESFSGRYAQDPAVRPARWFGVRATLFASGGPGRIVLRRYDTTAQVELESEHVRATSELRAVADSMGDALLKLDEAGHATYVNAAAERMLGWSVEDMRGRTLHELVHFYGTPHAMEQCPLARGHRAREAVRVNDDVFVRRDGTGLAVSWVLTPLQGEADSSSVLVVSDDAGARAAEQRLRAETDELAQVRDLHEALQEQRFELFGQPIIDVATGAVVSHELLLRMRERDGGLRLPGMFLPAAERSGLILELDRWVIGEAARMAGEGHHVELNLSAASLGDPALYDVFSEALHEHAARPECLGVELTETAIMRDEEIAEAFIERVGALGCELALDDFGTGFGGFGYLKSLPVDYLKIDVEFVRDLRTNVASRHVVQALVGLASSFGLRTVAEGVEDEETLDMVRDMGVDHAQGYGIGRPGPLAETVYSAV